MTKAMHMAGRTAFKKAVESAYKKMGKERHQVIGDMFNMADGYVQKNNMGFSLNRLEELALDESSALSRYVDRFFNEVDEHVLETAILNLGYEAMFCGTKKIHQAREKYKCNVPWLILMDPTSACNLHCTGCWAAEYGNQLNLSFEDMDKVIEEGKALGVYFYMYTGGEPLVRKQDLIRLAEKHRDCAFMAFTNGTLVDRAFCEELRRVGNLYLAISLEGTENSNDTRRGDGVYQKVMDSMDLLKEHGCLFGTSICYTKDNLEYVTSDEFIDMEIEKGVKYSMYFHYMPVGAGASPDLMPSPEQREYMYHRIRKIRDMKHGNGLFCFDFQNDGEYVGGCIAGGRNYFHINAGGDAEPCVFVHYSNSNIKASGILDILQSPLFMAYHHGQPFNENHLRPCPMLENPEILPKLVKETGAKSTDLKSPESAEELCAKCREYAEHWKETAEKLQKK